MTRPLRIFLLALSICLAGCSKEDTVRRQFGGPANVCLALSGQTATKAGYAVDEDNTVHSVRIYAFKHAPGETQNEECVGYGYFDGFDGKGPFNCPMKLSASGEIDFYVITNDTYAAVPDGQAALSENSSRADIEGFRFSGLQTGAPADGKAAVIMSNIPKGNTVDSNNFTFTVEEADNSSTVVQQVIPIDVTRAMGRLSFYFAKADYRFSVSINGISLRAQGPSGAGLFAADGAPDYTAVIMPETGILTGTTEISVINSTGSTEDDAMMRLSDEAYLLPNTYGSSDPDAFPAGTDYQTSARAYILDIDYSINGERMSKTVYLPPVAPNDWVKVKGIFNASVDVNMVIIALSWEDSEMDITFN